MVSTIVKRFNRKRRVKNKIFSNNKSNRIRLSVFRSNRHISVQLIDDSKGITLASASTLGKEVAERFGRKTANLAAAKSIGIDIAEKAKKLNIKNVVFDKGAFKYHGRIKAVAEAAREGNLNF